MTSASSPAATDGRTLVWRSPYATGTTVTLTFPCLALYPLAAALNESTMAPKSCTHMVMVVAPLPNATALLCCAAAAAGVAVATTGTVAAGDTGAVVGAACATVATAVGPAGTVAGAAFVV